MLSAIRRLSGQRGAFHAAPDANVLRGFREALIKFRAVDRLFERLGRAISDAGYLPMSGQIVDATLVVAPKQRNTETEKAGIKAGREGPGCVLAVEDLKGAAEGGRHDPSGRHRHSSLWLYAHLGRSPAQDRPPAEDHRFSRHQ